MAPRWAATIIACPCEPIAPGRELRQLLHHGGLPVKSLVTFPQSGITHELAKPLAGTRTGVDQHRARGARRCIDRLRSNLDDHGAQAQLKSATARSGWAAEIKSPKKGYYEVWARATDENGARNRWWRRAGTPGVTATTPRIASRCASCEDPMCARAMRSPAGLAPAEHRGGCAGKRPTPKPGSSSTKRIRIVGAVHRLPFALGSSPRAARRAKAGSSRSAGCSATRAVGPGSGRERNPRLSRKTLRLVEGHGLARPPMPAHLMPK